MPPTTEDGLAADQALDSKLEALYASETANSGPEQDTPAEVEAPETPVETPQAEERPATEPSESPSDDSAAKILAKYGNDPEKLASAYAQLESKLGLQGQELGEYRREVDTRIAEVQRQAAEQIAQVQAQQQAAQYAQQAPSAIGAALEQGNYYAAAETARQVGDALAYQQVMQAWYADPDQAFGAAAYFQQIAQQESENRILQQIDSRLGGIADNVQPLVQQNAQQSFEREFLTFGRDKDDFEQVAPAMLQVAQENNALINQLLASDDPGTRQQGYNFLYREARDRVGDTLAQAATTAATTAAEAARTAKTQATVGSASTSSQSKPQTKVEEFKAGFREILFNDDTSIARGLTRDQQ